MLQNYALITTMAKCLIALWSIILSGVSGTMISAFYYSSGPYGTYSASFPQGKAVLAACLANMVYFVAIIIIIFVRPLSPINALRVDIGAMTVLSLFTIGAMAGLSAGVADLNTCVGKDSGSAGFCSMGKAVIGMGWVLVAMIVGVLLIEIIVTARTVGLSTETLSTPFNEIIGRRLDAQLFKLSSNDPLAESTVGPVPTEGSTTAVDEETERSLSPSSTKKQQVRE